MTITDDPLDTIKDLLKNNWTETSPAVAATSFVVAPAKKKFTAATISVSRERDNVTERSTGSVPLVLHKDIIRACAWTQNKTELFNMLKEIRRIIHAKKIPASGGLLQLDLMPGGRPRPDLRVDDTILAEDVRIQLWYQEP